MSKWKDIGIRREFIPPVLSLNGPQIVAGATFTDEYIVVSESDFISIADFWTYLITCINALKIPPKIKIKCNSNNNGAWFTHVSVGRYSSGTLALTALYTPTSANTVIKNNIFLVTTENIVIRSIYDMNMTLNSSNNANDMNISELSGGYFGNLNFKLDGLLVSVAPKKGGRHEQVGKCGFDSLYPTVYYNGTAEKRSSAGNRDECAHRHTHRAGYFPYFKHKRIPGRLGFYVYRRGYETREFHLSEDNKSWFHEDGYKAENRFSSLDELDGILRFLAPRKEVVA